MNRPACPPIIPVKAVPGGIPFRFLSFSVLGSVVRRIVIIHYRPHICQSNVAVEKPSEKHANARVSIGISLLRSDDRPAGRCCPDLVSFAPRYTRVRCCSLWSWPPYSGSIGFPFFATPQRAYCYLPSTPALFLDCQAGLLEPMGWIPASRVYRTNPYTRLPAFVPSRRRQ